MVRAPKLVKTLDLVRKHIEQLKAVPVSITPVRYHNSLQPLDDKRIFYELDKKLYEKIKNTFKKKYPEIYWELVKGSVSNDPRGAKNNYARSISDVSKVPKVSEQG